ncbi:MAG: PepSY-associated TM helix domain-containing protein [Pseudomonadota bacterium]
MCLKKIRLVHAWSGLVLSFLLTVLSITGSMLIFKDDYLRARFPEANGIGVFEPEAVGKAMETIETQYGPDRLAYVSLARKNMSLHRIVFRDGSVAYAGQDGRVIQSWEKHGRIEDWIFHLHHYLFLGDFGKYLAGVTALCAVLMTATGIYLFLPFLPLFKGRPWPKSARRRDMLAHHRDLGVVFALPIIIITLTGAAMVFYKPAGSILSFLTLSKPAPFERPTGEAGDINWVAALKQAKTEFPEGEVRLVSWPRSTTAVGSIRMRLPGEWHQNGRTYAYINPQTSTVVATRNGNKLSRGERASNAIYPLHSIGVGGRLYDLIGVLTGMALTILGLFASWSYLNFLTGRRKKRRRQTAKQSLFTE